MATNYRRTMATAKDRPEPLHIDGLEVGDELVQADWSHYGSAAWREIIWTVTKILKNRLVISRDVTRDGEVITITERVLVTNRKSWPGENGRVQTRVEGQDEWDRDMWYLFTPDEPLLAELRTRHQTAAARQQARNTALSAANAIVKHPRHFTTDDARAAITALQVFIATHKED